MSKKVLARIKVKLPKTRVKLPHKANVRHKSKKDYVRISKYKHDYEDGY